MDGLFSGLHPLIVTSGHLRFTHFNGWHCPYDFVQRTDYILLKLLGYN
jgi:hypothetical protein